MYVNFFMYEISDKFSNGRKYMFFLKKNPANVHKPYIKEIPNIGIFPKDPDQIFEEGFSCNSFSA